MTALALKADPGSQEHADLTNRAEQESAFARPQAAINSVEFWLDTCQTSTEIHYGNFATLLDALVDFGQRGIELLDFLRNTSPITEYHKARAQLILEKAQEVLKQLEELLGGETLIQLGPDLQSEIDKLPGLVKDVKQIVEEIKKLLGDTSEDTDLLQKSQPQNT